MYTELQVTSNFSFRRGASHPEELINRAADLGYRAIAICDHNTMAGLVRAFATAKERQMKLIPAVRLDLLDGAPLLAYPSDKHAYARLSALLTKGNMRAEKEKCYLYKADVYEHAEGSFFAVIPPIALTEEFEFPDGFMRDIEEYKRQLGNHLFIAATRYYTGNDIKRMFLIAETGIPMLATNDVHYHDVQRRELQDVLTCVREKCNIFNIGYKLHLNAERYLKSVSEMQRLFLQYPEALSNTEKLATACNFDLSSLTYVYPKEISPAGKSPEEELRRLTWEGAHGHYGTEIPEDIRQKLNFELDFICRTDNASYFLTVEDYVRWAREQGILCQGRGSAANSVVCFCLGITSVNPDKFNLLFARFMSEERNEPPDIDVDFEHERREEVIQYIFNKYGHDRAAILPTVTVLHRKGAIRDVGRAMGLSVDTINKISSTITDLAGDILDDKQLSEAGLNPGDPHLRKVLHLTSQLVGFPRQLGQHTGGFIITDGKLSDLCPVFHARMENRRNIEWNKDDIDTLGFLKVDVLGLGMLTCIRKAFDMLKKYYQRDMTLASVPQDDPKVYEMVSAADTLGVFQIESRAQMSMLPRMKPEKFYDLVIEVAIVRPGPIQGDMVHPYLRRRNKEEDVSYPSEEIKAILKRTLGIPLFQEQAMEIAIVAGGFSPSEADQLRRSMATFKFNGKMERFQEKLVNGMIARGYTPEFAHRIFRQLEGFGSYGFPESHAVSFALLVYVSCWLKCYYPDVFAAALLNSQPMGFYQPAQIIRNAREHGVVVLPVDVNYSDWDNKLTFSSGKYALQLGFRQVKGLGKDDAELLLKGRKKAYESVVALSNVGISISGLETLAGADACRSLGLDRRRALWEIAALSEKPVGIFSGQAIENSAERQITLPFMDLKEHVVRDYSATGLSLKEHPVSFVRQQLMLFNVISCKDLEDKKDGDLIRIAGLVLVRQRPGTASGVCFITLEDEVGICNLVVFPKIFDKYRKEIQQSRLLMVEGKIQKNEVIHVVVQRCFNYTSLLASLMPATTSQDSPLNISENNIASANQPKGLKKELDVSYLNRGRNFK